MTFIVCLRPVPTNNGRKRKQAVGNKKTYYPAFRLENYEQQRTCPQRVANRDLLVVSGIQIKILSSHREQDPVIEFVFVVFGACIIN